MIIEEALKNLTPVEVELHELLKDKDEQVLTEYVLKRNFYKEPSQDEIDAINDIYESGTTIFDVVINGKINQMHLLSQIERQEINRLVDSEFYNTSSKTQRIFYSTEDREQAKNDLRICATVAASVITMDGENIEDSSVKFLSKYDGSVLKAKTYFIELLPYALIRSLYNKYTDFENRIFDIFSYETIKKKSTAPSEIV